MIILCAGVMLVGLTALLFEIYLSPWMNFVDPETIRRRVNDGDIQALRYFKALAKEDALRELEKYAAATGGNNREMRATAIQIMADKHVEPIYEQRIAEESTARSPGVVVLLERLGEFRTKAAIRIIGKYLYDDRRPIENDDDVSWCSYSFAAVEVLGNSGIPDAPLPPDPHGVQYGEREMGIWRQWWEANRQRFDP